MTEKFICNASKQDHTKTLDEWCDRSLISLIEVLLDYKDNKITKLEQALAVAEDALHVCAMDKSCSRHTYQCCGHCRPIGEAEEALEKIKVIKRNEFY